MSRPNRRHTLTVSLFPFLAVLICAMGALLFLLIVTTERIRSDAIAQAKQAADDAEQRILPVDVPPKTSTKKRVFASLPQPPPQLDFPRIKWSAPVPPVPEPVDPNIALRREIGQLRREFDQEHQELSNIQQQAAAAEAELSESAAQLSRTNEKLAEYEQQRDQDSRIRAELEQLRDKIAKHMNQLRDRLRKLDEEAANASSRFAFIPFEGQSGTTRRPIMIECTDEGLRFLPEQITISADDLEGFTSGDNPLLAGAESLAKHWSKQHRLSPETEPEPYILLLVRPSGSVAYYTARKLLDHLKLPSGYELIEADWQFDLPAADPQAVAVCRAAVEEALAHRPDLSAPFSSRPVVNNRGFRFRRGLGGGFIHADQAPDLLGRSPALKSGENDTPSSSQGNNAPSSRPNSPSQHASRDQRQQQNLARGKPARRPTRKIYEFSHNHESRGDGKRPANSRSTTKAESFLASPALQRLLEGDVGRPPDGESFSQQQQSRSEPQPASQSGRHQSTPRSSSSDLESGDERGSLKTSEQADASESNNVPNNSSRNSGPRSRFDESENRSSSQSNGDRSQQQRRPLIIQFNQSRANAQQQAPVDGSPAGTTASRSSTHSARQPHPGISMGSRKGTNPRSPTPRKRKWGLSNPASSIGFERDVHVEMQANRIIFDNETVLRVGRGETRRELNEGFLSALDAHTRTWGTPPRDFYWVPTLHFVVTPGGNQYYERLQGTLGKFGIRSSVEQSLEASKYRPTPRR